MNARMPVVFFVHGNPMNALADNDVTRAWATLGRRVPQPRAILAISAHWYVPGTHVTAMPKPPTIHDFGGFPRELFAVRYPAPGDPLLGSRVQELLAPVAVGRDHEWGLDHGTWSVLVHAFPQAEVPVVQLAIDETQPPRFHYEMGKRLAELRDEGVLLVGSGNVVHNLHAYAWGRHEVGPFDWAARFEEIVRNSVTSRDHDPLVNYEELGAEAQLSVPTPEHYLPLLYILGASDASDSVAFPVLGVDGGSISMLSVELGTTQE